MIPQVREELGCYHWVYTYPHFINKDGVDKREEHVGVETYPDEEKTKDLVLDDDREHHWRMFFQYNNGGVDGTKALLHAKKWYVYNSEKEALAKGGYSDEVSYKNSKRLIWEVVDDHVVEQGVEHEEVVIRGFDFNLFGKDREGCVGDEVKQLPYLLMIMKLWPSYWEQQLHQMSKKVDQDTGRGGTQENGRFWKLRRFSRENSGKTFCVFYQHLPLTLGG